LRSLGGATVLLVLYYSVPFNGRFDTHAVLLLTILLIVFVLVGTWQVRSIITSKTPFLRAIESLMFSIPLLILSFSLTYFLMARWGTHEFSQALSRTDALYFSTTTFATVGYGDIVAVSESARLVVTGQMLIDLVVLGLGVRVITQAVQMGRSARSSATGNDAGQVTRAG
jgi:voltage-gated potassium channel Kch